MTTVPFSKTNHRRTSHNGRKIKINLSRLVIAAVVVNLYLWNRQLSRISFPEEVPYAPFRPESSPDAYFNNFPVRLRDSNNNNNNNNNKFRSSVHCVGETHDPATAWKHRSCSYVHLCLDIGRGQPLDNNNNNDESRSPPEFFLVASKEELEFETRFRRNFAHGEHFYSSTELRGNHRQSSNSAIAATQQQQQQQQKHYSPLDVALGGINPQWRAPPTKRVPYQHGIDKISWTPRVYDTMPYEKYYELEDDVVLVPYHSFAAANVGHLLWDDFLPLYNLLKIFGYQANIRNKGDKLDEFDDTTTTFYKHLLLRVDTMPGLFGTCDLRPKKREACQKNLERFLPLFGVDPNTFSTLTEARLTKKLIAGTTEHPPPTTTSATDTGTLPPRYPVCAKHAVAGLGWLTDHGIRNHGWMTNHEEDSLDVALARNVGRGPELYAFRNFMLRNIGFRTAPKPTTTTTTIVRSTTPKDGSFRILLSAHSSNHLDRGFDFQTQQKALLEAFPNADVSVVVLSTMTPLEQIALVSNQPNADQTTTERKLRTTNSNTNTNTNLHPTHTIFVSACGGGSATAYFLPKGSSLILYYNDEGGMDFFANMNKTGGQALLDWDLYNNMGYLRVHWMPILSMDEPKGLESLISLVKHEMDGVLNGVLGV